VARMRETNFRIPCFLSLADAFAVRRYGLAPGVETRLAVVSTRCQQEDLGCRGSG
jgi:hypothetical protein